MGEIPDYVDFGQMIHFDKDGTPRLESVQWTNFLGRALASFEDFFHIAGHLQSEVKDHDMDGYQQLVRDHAPQLDALFA